MRSSVMTKYHLLHRRLSRVVVCAVLAHFASHALSNFAEDSGRHSNSTRDRELVVEIVMVRSRSTGYLSIFVSALAVERPMIPFPFHFPLTMFELSHRHPAFMAAGRWRHIGQVGVG